MTHAGGQRTAPPSHRVAGRARHSVRAIVCSEPPHALPVRRRAEDCPPYPANLVENAGDSPQSLRMKSVFTGPVYVVGDNIDTDQIIPAQYLTLVPTIAEEYEKLGSFAMIGLPDALYPTRFVDEGGLKTQYRIIIAGRNFGCGSSREHAPIALGAAGVCAVVAESFARIFFRNCVATGELYPYDVPERLCNLVQTGDV